MTQEISKNLKCLLMRSGIEIWIENERAENLRKILPTLQGHKFINFDNRILNTADLTGIFTPQDIEDLTKRKNGQWQCEHGNWHQRNEKCDEVEEVLNSINK